MAHDPLCDLRLRTAVGDTPVRPSDDFALSTWQDEIPVAVVDIPLSLFGATAPADLLPERPATAGFFEPLGGLAMREMFETAVFANFFDRRARPETLTLWKRR